MTLVDEGSTPSEAPCIRGGRLDGYQTPILIRFGGPRTPIRTPLPGTVQNPHQTPRSGYVDLVASFRRKLTLLTPRAFDIGLKRIFGRGTDFPDSGGSGTLHWAHRCGENPSNDRKIGPDRCRWHLVWVGLVFADLYGDERHHERRRAPKIGMPSETA